MPDQVLTTKEAAAYTHNTPGTLGTWRYLGKGPKYYKVGGKVLYRLSDLDEWINSHAVIPGASA